MSSPLIETVLLLQHTRANSGFADRIKSLPSAPKSGLQPLPKADMIRPKLNKDNSMATRIIMTLSAMALCATGISSAVQAETMDQTISPVTKLVPYKDLDLASDEGQKKLTLRIKSAVRSVCGDANGRELKAFQHRMQCEAEAMRLARIQKRDVIAQYRSGTRVAATRRATDSN